MTPGVGAIMVITIGVFLLQVVLDWLTGGALTRLLGLSVAGFKQGYLWQLVTYIFLHAGLLHIVFNLFTLFFIGPETERTIGTRHFLILYLASGIVGGLGWVLLNSTPWSVCIGASGAIFGVLTAFATLFPHRRITVLLYFIPITVEAWLMAVSLAVVQLIFVVTSYAGGVAYMAHLAGCGAGYLYIKVMLLRGAPPVPFVGPRRSWWREWTDHRRSAADRNREKEIDRILDKISSHGVQSLTRGEREVLEQASRQRTGGAG